MSKTEKELLASQRKNQMSMYRGKQRFDRQQLVFVVEAALRAAWDRIDSGLPESISWSDRLAHVNELHPQANGLLVWDRAALETAGMFLGILYAQLTNEGLGIGDVLACADRFDDVCEKLVADAWANEGRDYVDSPSSKPDFQAHAEVFVQETFDKDYFSFG